MSRPDFLPFSVPSIGQEEKDAVAAVLDSGWLSTGPQTARFEQSFSQYIGADQCLAVSSCTAGLHLALVAAGIGPGDEVITSPLTFVSTANVIIHVGATPVFADIDSRSYTISAGAVERVVTSRTKAIIPVHYAGHPCDLAALREIAAKHNLLIIEDAAHALGSRYRGAPIGAVPEHVTVFSFYATKNITTGEGGMVVTGRRDLSDSMRRLSLHGMSKDAWGRYSSRGSWWYSVDAAGFKYNMTDLQAALGLCQLAKLDQFIERRQSISDTYNHSFASVPEVTTPILAPDIFHSRHLYPVLLNDNSPIDRDQFIVELRRRNIGTSVHFIPVHLHAFYREKFGFERGMFPVAESVFNRILSLPLFPKMSDEDVKSVVSAVNEVFDEFRPKHTRSDNSPAALLRT